MTTSKSIIAIGLSLITILIGCAITKVGVIEGELPDPFRNYSVPFDRAWEATVNVMQRYPIITIEKASGLLVTDWIEGTSDLYYEYEEGSNDRRMLLDRVKYNVKVSPLTDGNSRVTINQYIKLYMPGPSVHSMGAQLLAPGLPTLNYGWIDLSGVKDLPQKTSSPRVKEILDAINAELKE